MFRGKESSNRIELSRLVQDLVNFGVLGSLRFWGGGRWVGGVSRGIWGHGGVPTCMHMHAHTQTCMHAHVYMYRNCKWPPTWRHPCLSCLTCMCMHAYVCVHVCMHGTLTHTPVPTPLSSTHLPPPRGDPQNQLKFNNT